MPAKAGTQVKGMGMDPGFHRGDDKAWIPVLRPRSGHAFAGKTDGAVDFQSTCLMSHVLTPRFPSAFVALYSPDAQRAKMRHYFVQCQKPDTGKGSQGRRSVVENFSC